MSDLEETKIVDDMEQKATPAPAPKKKREGIKMTDKAKSDLKKYMDKQTNLSVSEKRSLRMKLMARQRKGMSINKAVKDIAG